MVRRWHYLFYLLIHLSKSSIHPGQEILGVFLSITMQNIDNSIKFSKVSSFSAGPSLAGLATVSVLLFEKEEYFHSTSHYSSRRKNTSALRVITLREGRILPLYESLLFEQEEYFHSTSHPSGVNSSSHFHSTSHYSSREELPALRVITLREGRILHTTSHYSSGRMLPLHESLLFGGGTSCSTSYYSLRR